jgi:hypothetical protein
MHMLAFMLAILDDLEFDIVWIIQESIQSPNSFSLDLLLVQWRRVGTAIVDPIET